jgi:hypothetical protein
LSPWPATTTADHRASIPRENAQLEIGNYRYYFAAASVSTRQA